MRKLWLSPQIENIADDYRDEVMAHHNPITALRQLLNALNNANAVGLPHKQEYIEYVKRLCFYFLPSTDQKKVRLLNLKPDKWDDKKTKVFNIVRDEWLSETLVLPNLGEKRFYEFVNDALGYEKLRGAVLRKYVAKLGIKTCYYCNAQYAIAAEEDNGQVYASYELDHCKAKSTYPFLSICFYNFHPSCPVCNKRKSNTFEVESMYQWQSGPGIDPFRFELDKKSIVKYMLSNDKEDLSIGFSCPSTPQLATDYETHFHISTIYSQHKDAAEELIWKARCYRDADIEAIYTQYRKLFSNKSKDDFKRMLYGHHLLPSEAQKRPLNKMLSDIAKQLKIV